MNWMAWPTSAARGAMVQQLATQALIDPSQLSPMVQATSTLPNVKEARWKVSAAGMITTIAAGVKADTGFAEINMPGRVTLNPVGWPPMFLDHGILAVRAVFNECAGSNRWQRSI
jgi:hypothetical protein